MPGYLNRYSYYLIVSIYRFLNGTCSSTILTITWRWTPSFTMYFYRFLNIFFLTWIVNKIIFYILKNYALVPKWKTSAWAPPDVHFVFEGIQGSSFDSECNSTFRGVWLQPTCVFKFRFVLVASVSFNLFALFCSFLSSLFQSIWLVGEYLTMSHI